MTGTAIYVGNRLIGHIEGEEFVKHMDGGIHMLKKPPAWATDAEAWLKIRDRVRSIRVIDLRTSDEYILTVEEFDKYRFTVNRNFGLQYAVPLKKWRRPGDPEPRPPEGEQAPLFQ